MAPRHHTYHPYWRSKGRAVTPDVEVVADPDAAWFEAVTKEGDDERQIVRLALMEDGEILFGDAYHVVHQDIMQCRGPLGEGPIYVAVIIKTKTKPWFLGLVQQFIGGGGGEATRVRNFRALAGRMTNWQGVLKELGCDPLETWSGDEEFGR